jgi:predicted ester cyclase
MSVDENKAALERAIASWNSGDLSGYLELYDPEIRLHGYSPQPMDKAAVTEFYAGSWDVFTRQKLTIQEVFGADEKLCVRFTNTGTHEGVLMGVPPTGRELTMEGITVMHFREGRCIERWSVVDGVSALMQMGAFPSRG